jgi:hypothetical protein
MTVRELIEQLCKLDSEADVMVAVRSWTQAYAVAIVTPFDVSADYSGATVWVSLPENMHTVSRKK